MISPRYTISDELLAQIRHITERVSGLNHRVFARSILTEFSEEAGAISVHSSLSLEGNPLSLKEVRQLLKSRPQHLSDSEREVINYHLALEKIDQWLDDEEPLASPLNLERLLEIHQIVMADLLPPQQTGQLRLEAHEVKDPLLGKTIYWPPDPEDVPVLMVDLISFITEMQGKIDPLILAGLFHKQSLIIQPFSKGNERTTRLATRLLLSQMGLKIFPLFSFEHYDSQNTPRYLEQVSVWGDFYDLSQSSDFTPWLIYFMDGLINELQRFQKALEQRAATPENRPLPVHQIILDHIAEHGYITDKIYSEQTGRAKATRTLDFKRLIGLGLIDRKGKGKNTYYVVVSSSEKPD